MDEHPGGGGVGAVGAGAPRQPSPQQHGSNSASPPIGGGGGGGVMVPHQPEDLPRPQQQYTIPGILHYIQHEWARFEMERAHWEVERAELQVSPISLALNAKQASSSCVRQQPATRTSTPVLAKRMLFAVN